jgi:amino-acid N-acetyltransferase
METIEIKQFTGTDYAEIIQLLKISNLPFSDIGNGKQIFLVAEKEHKMVGCVAIEVYQKNGLLRSLAVDVKERDKNIGHELMAKIINLSIDKQLVNLYLLTTTAEKYFNHLGWNVIDRNSVSADILNSQEFASICPVSAVCMAFSLLPVMAQNAFNSGFNCAQSTFYPFAVQSDMQPEHALKIATGFGSGLVAMGETCGAITGAMMAIGLHKGRALVNDWESKDKTNQLIHELLMQFTVKHGALRCKDLLNKNFPNTESWQEARAEGLCQSHCAVYIKDAAAIVADLLNRED